jgi:hypothetical protein
MLCSTLDIKIIGDELIEYRYAAARNCCKTNELNELMKNTENYISERVLEKSRHLMN